MSCEQAKPGCWKLGARSKWLKVIQCLNDSMTQLLWLEPESYGILAGVDNLDYVP
jgi:hypothetical protein